MARCYFCSDLHGSDVAFRKFLNAIKLGVYKAEVAIIGGDLTGKAVVPILRLPNGKYQARVFGGTETAGTQEERAMLKKKIADFGLYPYEGEEDELRELEGDSDRQHAVFRRLMRERLQSWLELAEERIGKSGVKVYIMPGNDDDAEIDPVLNASTFVENADGRVVPLDDRTYMATIGHSNPTPWKTFREYTEPEYSRVIAALVRQSPDLSRTVFNFHVPPYGSGLDTAPQLDEQMRPKVSAGELLKGPVGSTAVRDALMEYQPLMGLFGHVHESGGDVKLGRTVCLNPGSEANNGILRGYVFDIGSRGVQRYYRVHG